MLKSLKSINQFFFILSATILLTIALAWVLYPMEIHWLGIQSRTGFSATVIMKNFIEMISDRSLFLSKKLNEFALQSLKSRLLNYLKINGRIDNQQEVAFILGVARPSLARALSELIAEKKVSMNGKEAIITE